MLPPPISAMPSNRIDSTKHQILADLIKEPGNDRCADCDAPIDMENTWAVLTYGILVCDDCKLVHIEHQNHYQSPEDGDSMDAGTNGILSTQFAHIWEEKDVAQIKANGNKRSNDNLLKNVPTWQYRPSPNDGIKLKEHWITYKYSGKAGEGPENSITASKKSFLGYQFIRPMPEGNSYHCCAVLQNDVLYLTSDKRNEEVPIDCIETVIVNSKRIGHENGIQLTYRSSKKDGNIAAYTYLQHESMDTVMIWVNLVLYTKYNLFKQNYPNMSDANVAKNLNCGVVKESYIYVTGRGLIYMSVSEARLCCFKHHLDDQPMFQIALSEVMNLNASQYLDAVACYFDIDSSKIQSYGDWFNALETVLKADKLAALPEDFAKPTFPFALLKSDKPAPPAEKTDPPANKEKSTPVSSASKMKDAPANSPPPIKKDTEKENEKKPSNYECYPPIGPMGEMGKVFRGELSPDAIKPPPSKNDIARVGVFGDYISTSIAGQVPLPIKSASYNDLMGQSLASLSSSANTSIISQAIAAKENVSCYPPIGGPVQARKLQYDVSALTALQAAHIRREQEAQLSLEELRNNPTAMLNNPIFRQSLASKQSLFDQARLPTSLGSVTEASLAAAAGLGQAQYQGWGDAGTDNLLTVPWKPTTNGYEPSRNFNANTQYADMWNPPSKMQGGASFGIWGGRPSSNAELQQTMMGRSQSNWGGSGIMPSGGSMDHWPNKSPTSPIDTFMLPNNRDIRGSAATSGGMFGATGSRNNALNGTVRSRNDSPSGASPHPNVVIDNLVRQWQLAEQRLLGLIHNAYVPASDMTPAGLDKDSAEHAYTCVNELFELLWKQRYDLALSFLRGFREVFANSSHAEIRNQFIGAGELDTMRQIFLQQGKEKFLSGSSGGPVTLSLIHI